MSAPAEISGYELDYCLRESIPLPTKSALERMRHLAVFRNRLNLYPGECAYTGKKGLTAIPPDRGFTVYDVDVWNSDRWSALDYGRPYDFSKPFFEQFGLLLRQVPIPNLSVNRPTMENSDHTNGITGAKNCYLIFSSSFNEDCFYGRLLFKCTDVYNTVYAKESELCFGCSNVQHCYNLLFANDCYHCNDSAFMANCRSCSDCYGCYNLANRRYCIYNQQMTREEYLRRKGEIDLGSHQILQREIEKFKVFSRSRPLRLIDGVQNENVSGQMISNSKNCNSCYCVTGGEDLDHCWYVNNVKSSLFYFGYGNSSELIYSSVTVGDQSFNVKFCVECWPGVRDLEYCYYLGRGAHDCFGCVGLTRQNFCILNKQYSQSEYKEIVARIKKQMLASGEYGRLFPTDFAIHAYNKSEAADWFPATKEQVLKWGYRWSDAEPEPKSSIVELADHVMDVTETDLTNPFLCQHTSRLYRILKPELEFHKRLNVALPRLSPFERLRLAGDFLAIRPVRASACTRCATPFSTSRPETQAQVLCERCYELEISG